MIMFKDHFSQQPNQYAKYRPTYPEALFTYLVSLTPTHELAWDCATGNGQVALGLTPYFRQIQATDASPQQIAHGFAHPQITYQVALAEYPPFADRSIDLITVGQALHWFELDSFYAAVKRVLKPEGAIAIWGYGFCRLPEANPAVLSILAAFCQQVEPFWPPERQVLNHGYRGIPFPFMETTSPQLAMEISWSVDQLLGYLGTWSATQRCIAEQGSHFFQELSYSLSAAWGDRLQLVQWPLHLRVGYIK